jgi:hypothetical protein
MRIVWSVLLLCAGSAIPLGCRGLEGQPLPIVAVEDRRVYGNTGDARHFIMELAASEELPGACAVDDKNLFLAVLTGDSEASSKLALFGVRADRLDPLGEIGATGESRFVCDAAHRLVVFNWYNGIHGFYVGEHGVGASASAQRSVDRTFVHLVPCKDGRCFELKWAGPGVVSYRDETGPTPVVRELVFTRDLVEKIRARGMSGGVERR